MALVVDADGSEPYREINVDVASLTAWSEELHRLVGLTQAANSSVGHWSVNAFVGYGPPGALHLRDLNAQALANLATAVGQLDVLIARLRDAASAASGSYAESDASAAANTSSVEPAQAGVDAAPTGEAAGPAPVVEVEPVVAIETPGSLTALAPDQEAPHA